MYTRIHVYTYIALHIITMTCVTATTTYVCIKCDWACKKLAM